MSDEIIAEMTAAIERLRVTNKGFVENEGIARACWAVVEKRMAPRPLSEWHEDLGEALWWRFPIEEAPYSGSPLDTNWPGYHTHWTPIIIPAPP